MENDTTLIGVDLGGTKIRAGLISEGKILKNASSLVPKTSDALAVTDALIKTIHKVFNHTVEGIGIGVPGLVKSGTGVVYDIQNIPSWKCIQLKDILEEIFQCPVYVNNDANCFAVGERVFGKGKAYDDFVGLITGTGVGAGIIKAGHLLPDQNCGAGEFGMIDYLDSNYEYYCSGQFFMNRFQKSGEELAQQAALGLPEAIVAFNEYGEHLGKAIKAILFAVDPKVVIMGGSVSKSYTHYQKAMWTEIANFPYQFVLNNFRIETSDMGEIAILGAGALYIDAMNYIETV